MVNFLSQKMWESSKHYVSPFNFDVAMMGKLSLPKKLKFHDVTLRDGEQQAGLVFTKYDKVMIGRSLNRAGVDRIEVGTPGISAEDRDAMRALIAATLDAKLYSWCRNKKLDIMAAKECGSQGITIEVPASQVIMKDAYSTTVAETLSTIAENAGYAKSEGLEVLLLLVDSTRSDLETLKMIIDGVEKYCDAIALSDSFGVIFPFAMFNLVSKVKSMTNKPVEVHCHNDFGMATANTLAAVAAGASVAHVTVNGIGERAGNTPLGEVALGAKLLLGVDVTVRLEELYRLSNATAEITGFPTPPNKPIVGQNVFNIESAQAAQWLVKSASRGYAYPFSKDLVGHPGYKLILSKKSGPQNLELKLKELGLKVNTDKYPQILGMIYERSLQKKGAITDDELLEILQDLNIYK